jgi:hypothetical protein
VTQVRTSKETTFKLPESRLYIAHRAWVLFLQGLFRSRERGDFHWNFDDNETEISIQSTQPTEVESQHRRPLIVVQRLRSSTLGASRDQTLQISFTTGVKTFTRLHNFNIVIMVVAREGVEAENLLWFIDEMILPFKPQIQRVGRMHHISNRASFSEESRHGSIVPGSSVPEWRSVSLVIECSVQSQVRASLGTASFDNIARSVNLQLETAGSE